MPDSPTQDPGDGAVSRPANQPGTFDVESLLSEFIQTDAGAAYLAQALKDRPVRDMLKQHGVKIQTTDDVGYNSLPLEIRDQIRRCAIASVQPVEGPNARCGRCPRLAPYACIDSEWRDAVERVTFQQLRLGAKDGELELLEHHVVGNRQHYLQHIVLAVNNPSLERLMHGAAMQASEHAWEDALEAFIAPIRQLFNCVKQWSELGTGNGNLLVAFNPMFAAWDTFQFRRPSDRLRAGLTNLPTIPQITRFFISLWDPIDVESLLVLLSHMPNLRFLTIILKAADPQPNVEDYDSQIQLFFNSLPHTAPNLEAMEATCIEGLITGDFQVMFCAAALSYSQRLRKFSLDPASLSTLRSSLAPFSTAKFRSKAPPPLLWPNLTDFSVAKVHIPGAKDDLVTQINELLLTVGRAIRYMPRIQNLEMKMTYHHWTEHDDGLRTIYRCGSGTDIALNLEPLRVSGHHSPQGRLSVVVRNSLGLNLAKTVPSEEVKKVWEKSLIHATGATLEVQVISEDGGTSFVSL